MIWILIGIAFMAIVYLTLIRPHKYWINRGVKQGNPAFLFGDNWGTVLHKQSFGGMVRMVYNVSPNSRYCGLYQFLEPALMIRDPDLIKQIIVKDFDHFVNRRNIFPKGTDPLWSKSLVLLTNQEWRDMRTTLSPVFTISKIKNMFSLISENGEQFAQYFLKQNKEVITVEMNDTFSRFTNDVIASAAFGVKCDSLSERDNEFYLMGKDATDFTDPWQRLKMLGYCIVPQLNKVLNVTFFSKQVGKFFTNVVKDSIANREKQGIVKPDMIQLLMEARKPGFKNEERQPIQDTSFATVQESEISKNSEVDTRQITDEDITSQALTFFFAGFDTVTSLMCFMSYELAINPDAQKRLIQEIDETLERCKGKLTYEALTNLKYMDMVVSETLRMWPSGVVTDRICTKPYTIEPKLLDEKPLHLTKNTVIWIPIFALHRDPQYFPDPDRFDPERFSDENKHKIQPYTYLPFGAGPRTCMGSRFAVLETKALFFHILSNFEIVPVKETRVPLQLNRRSFNMTAEGGFWFGLKRRVK